MKKIVFIIPYFGKFNNYFQFFLNSCKYNNSVDWLIFTDDMTNYDYPKNVKVIYTTFNKIREQIQKKFDFKISLDNPYKLCDFKVSYGYVFQEYIKKYDFWGYCDIDLIWGNIRQFYTDKLLNNFDKIGFFGHCTIFRNRDEINKLFMSKINGIEEFKKVFSSTEGFAFDEERHNSINTIFEKNNIKCDFTEYQANPYTKSSFFRMTTYNHKNDRYYHENKKDNYKKKIIIYNRGNLIRYEFKENVIEKKEYLYIHMQSRKMKIKTDNYDIYKIIPNSFEDLEEYPITNVNFRNIKIYNINLHYFKLRSKNLYLKIKKRVKKICK